jgi:hypothetical protein
MFTVRVRSARRFSGFMLPAVLVAALLSMLPTTLAAQQTPTILYSAGAYGSQASVAGIVTVARTAPVAVGSGCGTAKVPSMVTGTVASLNALPLLTTGLVNTSASDAPGIATGSSDVHSLTLLAGLISATEIKSVSTTTVDSHQVLQSSAAGSTFVNLNVLGRIINGLPAPNTTIPLANLGRIVLNEQISSRPVGAMHLTVNMVHLYITLTNVLGIPIGTEVIVSDASSGLTVVGGPGALEGTAYGTTVSGTLLSSGPTASASVPCQGTNGIVKTNTLAALNLPLILNSGTIVDTAVGTVSPGFVNSETTSTVQGLNLLSGLLTANVIHAHASGTTTDGVNFNFAGGGSFTGISVAGHPEITDNVPPNTQIPILNLGTLYLNRVILNNNTIQNRMVELIVNHSNTLGLPIGLDIKISYAEAGLHSITHP